MAESTIPYSFTPGTKAKASEVNANFLALANGLDESKEYTKTEITNLESKLDEKVTEINESNAFKDLSNTNFTTNCILEAPNGIASYENTTITVKEGLKLLISNGRNSNGTLKNIEYTVDKDIQYTPNMNSEKRDLFIASNGNISSYDPKAVHISTIQPKITQTEGAWYNPIDNIWKVSNNTGNTWTESNIIRIGFFETDDSTITSLKNENPINILKYDDKAQIINWTLPDYDSEISIPRETPTQVEFDGIIVAKGGANTGNIEIANIYVGPTSDNITNLLTYSRIGTGVNDRQTLFVPMSRGYWYRINAPATTTVSFFPLKGVTNA